MTPANSKSLLKTLTINRHPLNPSKIILSFLKFMPSSMKDKKKQIKQIYLIPAFTRLSIESTK